MLRRVVPLLVAAFFGSAAAFAQETAGAGRFELSEFPGGGMWFTASDSGNEPDFANYAVGVTGSLNFNKWVGIEGDGGATIGLRQKLVVSGNTLTRQQTPSMWMYSGNLVLHPVASDHAWVPYATGGVGGLTLTPYGEVENLGISHHETYLTGNVGGGLKWFSMRRWGIRADYRYFMVKDKTNAPFFFGNEKRYAHRVQAGVIFTY